MFNKWSKTKNPTISILVSTIWCDPKNEKGKKAWRILSILLKVVRLDDEFWEGSEQGREERRRRREGKLFKWFSRKPPKVSALRAKSGCHSFGSQCSCYSRSLPRALFVLWSKIILLLHMFTTTCILQNLTNIDGIPFGYFIGSLLNREKWDRVCVRTRWLICATYIPISAIPLVWPYNRALSITDTLCSHKTGIVNLHYWLEPFEQNTKETGPEMIITRLAIPQKSYEEG